MADLSDVISTLAALADAALYPNGDGMPGVMGAASITIAPGWPNPKQLDKLLAAGNAMVTVYPMPGADANTKRFPEVMTPQQDTMPVANLALTAAGLNITVGGTIKAGEAAALRVNYKTYSRSVLATDTTATIAAALAALIPGATASGSVVTVAANTFDLFPSISVPVLMQMEVGRQTRVFLITAWCPTPAMRDTLIKALDLSLRQQQRIVMSDNTWARMIYRGTLETDELSTRNIFRRDLRYEVEYATTLTEIDNTVVTLNTIITPI